MKKRHQGLVLLSVLVTAAFVSFIMPIQALTPSEIKLRYDLDKRVLLVTIKHDQVWDSSNYIRFIEIKKNGTVVSIHTYQASPEGKSFTDSYRINAIEEDTLQVVATFNHGAIVTSSVLIVAP